jgi:short-subunit dehydrogenase
MIEKKSGHIFNMSSIAGLKAYPNGGSYSISKFAMRGFSINLRDELKPYNIKVTTVFPGAAYTDSWAASGLERKDSWKPATLLKWFIRLHNSLPTACVEEIILRPQLGDI